MTVSINTAIAGGAGTGSSIVAGTTISGSRVVTYDDVGKRFTVDTSGGAVAITTATGVFTAGTIQSITFVRSGANALTFVQGASTTLRDPATVVVANGASVVLINHPTLSDNFEVVG